MITSSMPGTAAAPLDALHRFVDAALGNGNHHDARGRPVQPRAAKHPRPGRAAGSVLPAACRPAKRSAWRTVRRWAARASPASTRLPGCSAVRRAPARGASPSARTARAVVSISACLHLGGLARRRHVDGLLEERALQRIGLVEDGERLEFARGDQPFHGEFAPRNVAFHLQRARSPILPMRRNAATNSLGSSARITPRLAESPSGLSTHGYGARAGERARIVGERRAKERGHAHSRRLVELAREVLVLAGARRRRRMERHAQHLRPPPPPARRAGRPPRPRHRTRTPRSASSDSGMRSNFTAMARSPQGSSRRWQRSVASVRSHAQPPRRIGKHADLVAGGGGEQQQTFGH